VFLEQVAAEEYLVGTFAADHDAHARFLRQFRELMSPAQSEGRVSVCQSTSGKL
jgi:hypothetical protein